MKKKSPFAKQGKKYVMNSSKYVTCVTKTIANLTTYYSRNPGDYNDTIIFEIDIMKTHPCSI